MRVKTFYRMLRYISAIVLFFFLWTFGPVWQAVAFTATPQKMKIKKPGVSGKRIAETRSATSAEKFEKAVDDIRQKLKSAEDKSHAGVEPTTELDAIKARLAAIESTDAELKAEFSATEKKLKDAKLPKVILDRHYAFVKQYQDNLKELVANLTAVERGVGHRGTLEKALKKAKEHLDKVKAPSHHQKLDPNNLPFRNRKVLKAKAPRLRKKDFEKDFPQQIKTAHSSTFIASSHDQKSRNQEPLYSAFRNSKFARERKPILVASNGPLTGLLSSVPEPEIPALPFPAPIQSGVDGNSLPSAANGVSPNLEIPSAMSNEPSAMMLAQADPPTSNDLAETPEAQFTQAIKDLATQLNHSPVKIYEWVRNNIDYTPTYGSIQGADLCLQSRQCNSIDTASLLLALLRTSNIPAHYVHGTIEVPIDKLMNWAGGFTDPMAAVSYLASGGIPIKSVISGGKITKVQMEQTWVEAYIPYGNYRGSGTDDSLKNWIPMDGSFKQYAYTKGFDITATVPFDENAYMSQVQSQNAAHYYQSQIQSYLDVNMPDTSIIEAKGYRVITPETYHFLPSTLPYTTVAKLGIFQTEPASMDAMVTFTLSDPATGSQSSYSASVNLLADKRITVSYIPATANDEALISTYGGFLYDVPAYMLNLKPVIRVEGVIQLTGEPTTLGADQRLAMQFMQPSGNNETVNKNLVAGAYYAVRLDLQGVNESVLGKRNYQLTKNVLSETAGTLGNDDLIGEHLFILATAYFLANDKLYQSAAKLFNVVITRTLSEGITSFTLSVVSIFGQPKSAIPSGINMDIAMDRIVAVAKDGIVQKEIKYMDIAGLVSSYNEHDIFEKIDNFASVSAVKALQVASANGIPITVIDSSNIAQIKPTLQVSSEVQMDIQNAVNEGKKVLVSQTNVQIDDWNGVGYIVKDPVTGAGAYMISGGLAGSDSVGKATGMQIAELFEGGALAWILNNLDPMIRGYIVLAADKYTYDQVDEGSPDASQVDAYDAVGECSGLVRRAYWAAGICLDDVPPPLGVSCGKSLQREWIHVVDGEKGVEIHYDLADTMKIYGSVRQKPINNPLTGDIVFFYDSNGNLNHEGIVTAAPDSLGTVKFIHALPTAGVHYGNVTISSPDTAALNEYIGNPTTCGNTCRSGQLFAGWGTIRTVHKQN